MDEDAIIAAVAQVRSTIKQAICKITGETRTQAGDATEKATDDAQSAVGTMKDTAPARPPK